MLVPSLGCTRCEVYITYMMQQYYYRTRIASAFVLDTLKAITLLEAPNVYLQVPRRSRSTAVAAVTGKNVVDPRWQTWV